MTDARIVRYGIPQDCSEPVLSASAVTFGGVVYTTQIPDRPDGTLELGDVRLQCRQVLRNLAEQLGQAGSSMAKLLHVTVFLSDMGDRDVFNDEYAQHVPQPVPARCCIAVAALAYDGMKVELTAQAAVI